MQQVNPFKLAEESKLLGTEVRRFRIERPFYATASDRWES